MKTITHKLSSKIFAFLGMLLGLQSTLLAQDAKVEINGNDVGSWFSQNWMWVSGIIVLLILIILFSGSSRRRKITTIERNGPHGNKRVVTTTTEEED